MSTRTAIPAVDMAIAVAALAATLGLPGCTSDGYSGGSSSSVGVSVGYGYGGYYGGYGGYYAPYPPVVVVPPDERPDRPNSGNRPTTLPAGAGGSTAKLQPARPSTTSRSVSRPSPRPATRPMPRGRR